MRRRLMFAALVAAMAFGPPTARAQSELVDGQVTKVDAPANKLTIRHGPIKKFGFDESHTMVFAVQDATLLGGIKAGDRIKFEADRINGQFVVTRIEKGK
jgi:Cu(I)/Ag(I) efflux system periplasmic protein CusF